MRSATVGCLVAPLAFAIYGSAAADAAPAKPAPAAAPTANDQPLYGPPPAWVRPLDIPKPAESSDGSPVQVLLYDQQSRLTAEGNTYYSEQAFKILSPQGLGALGNLTQTWDPATQSLTIHHVRILRGGQVIDALADGHKFAILRRETNLELSMLDGRLTATLQPEGLQVGDIIDFAMSVVDRDPALRGYSADQDRLSYPGQAARIFWRTTWPTSKTMRYRVTEGVPTPTLTKSGEGSELIVDMADKAAPKPPAGAPTRFADIGSLEVSQFKDWTELSRLLSPLYEKAATLPDSSPLKAEIARIAAASADPKQRALAALRLVEDQTRYVFLGMNDGGLTPADADLTWSRRFGDCKGKSVLLTALLHGLGIEAAPTVVSTTFGDGMDARLPSVSWFDHVIVRAKIGGKTYWLDGTRLGDLDLDDLIVPPFYWALPLEPAGTGLARLDPTPLTQPGMEEQLTIDASAGADVAAATQVKVVYRGEDAANERQALAAAPRAEFERKLREYWSKVYPWLDIKQVDILDERESGRVTLLAKGSGKLEWSDEASGARFLRIPYSALGGNAAFKREPSAHPDAPYAVQFPYYSKITKRIVLPRGVDFTLVGEDVSKTVAGMEEIRHSRIESGVLTVELSHRAVAPEFPAADAETAGATLRELAGRGVSILYNRAAAASAGGRVSAAPAPGAPAAGLDALRAAAEHGDAAAQYALGHDYEMGDGLPYDLTQAFAWYKKAGDAGNPKAQAALANFYDAGVGTPKDPAAAMVWLRKAADQNEPEAQAQLALAYSNGEGVPRDIDRAAVLARQSAAQNNADGKLMLGQMTLRGEGVVKDVAGGLVLLKQAADQGSSRAQAMLALIYRLGAYVPKDEAAALVWAQKSADQGDAGGQEQLAWLYRAAGPRQDDAKALAMFRKAAGRGNVSAQLELGAMYYSGIGAAKDVEESYRWVQKAADQGSRQGQYLMGSRYLGGHGVPADDALSLAWFRKAADQGDPRAQNDVGLAYENGKGVPQDVNQAITWFKKSAAQSHASAENNLGALYADGKLVARDEVQAMDWFRRAAEHGSPEAQFSLGRAYQEGRGVNRDLAQGFFWFQKAADQGQIAAIDRLAESYWRGLGTPRDEVQAMAWYRKAAEQGDRVGERGLGALMLQGKAGSVDYAAAIGWLTKAAEQGDTDVAAPLGQAYLTGVGAPRDYTKALMWFQKGAQAGSAESQLRLAGMYLLGQGVAADRPHAAQLFLTAAQQGAVRAELQIGVMFLLGDGVAADPVQAVTWLSKAADQGDTQAQSYLGQAYVTGQGGVAKDYAKALVLLQAAADKGNRDGELELGFLYDHGFGVKQDFALAMSWYRKAADQGNTMGMVNVGVTYAEGRGVPRDPAQAIVWYRKAADAGNVIGERLLAAAYLSGIGVAADKAQGMAWLTKAAAGGDDVSKTHLEQLNAGAAAIPPAQAATTH